MVLCGECFGLIDKLVLHCPCIGPIHRAGTHSQFCISFWVVGWHNLRQVWEVGGVKWNEVFGSEEKRLLVSLVSPPTCVQRPTGAALSVWSEPIRQTMRLWRPNVSRQRIKHRFRGSSHCWVMVPGTFRTGKMNWMVRGPALGLLPVGFLGGAPGWECGGAGGRSSAIHEKQPFLTATKHTSVAAESTHELSEKQKSAEVFRVGPEFSWKET